MDKIELIARLEKTVEGLDKMIDGVMLQAMSQDIDPYQMLNTTGAPLLAPLIISQSSALLMIATLSR